jgi:hypothetical protein
MISRPALARALLTVEKNRRDTLPFACTSTPGWLWAGPWAVRSDKMKAARVEDGNAAAAAAADILRTATRLPSEPTNRLVLRNGPRDSSDGTLSLYVLASPHGNSCVLVGLDARLWPLVEGLELWGIGPRELVAGFKQGRVEALVMPRVLSEADKDPAPPKPLSERVRAACKAATDAMVTHYDPMKTLKAMDAADAAENMVERNARAIVRAPGLATEVRTLIADCQAPAWVSDRARYAELMRKRSSRAGDFHSKIIGYLDKAEAAERKRAFAAPKVAP